MGFDDLFGVFEQFTSVRGDRERVAVSQDQTGANPLLETADLQAHSGLSQTEPFGSSRESALGYQLAKDAKRFDIQSKERSLSDWLTAVQGTLARPTGTGQVRIRAVALCQAASVQQSPRSGNLSRALRPVHE